MQNMVTESSVGGEWAEEYMGELAAERAGLIMHSCSQAGRQIQRIPRAGSKNVPLNNT